MNLPDECVMDSQVFVNDSIYNLLLVEDFINQPIVIDGDEFGRTDLTPYSDDSILNETVYDFPEGWTGGGGVDSACEESDVQVLKIWNFKHVDEHEDLAWRKIIT